MPVACKSQLIMIGQALKFAWHSTVLSYIVSKFFAAAQQKKQNRRTSLLQDIILLMHHSFILDLTICCRRIFIYKSGVARRNCGTTNHAK